MFSLMWNIDLIKIQAMLQKKVMPRRDHTWENECKRGKLKRWKWLMYFLHKNEYRIFLMLSICILSFVKNWFIGPPFLLGFWSFSYWNWTVLYILGTCSLLIFKCYLSCGLFCCCCCAGKGYMVALTKVLSMYQIYHTYNCILHYFPLSLLPPFL
jgi:hypothetical protein